MIKTLRKITIINFASVQKETFVIGFFVIFLWRIRQWIKFSLKVTKKLRGRTKIEKKATDKKKVSKETIERKFIRVIRIIIIKIIRVVRIRIGIISRKTSIEATNIGTQRFRVQQISTIRCTGLNPSIIKSKSDNITLQIRAEPNMAIILDKNRIHPAVDSLCKKVNHVLQEYILDILQDINWSESLLRKTLN